MKIVVLSSKLKEGLGMVERVVRDGGNLPILKNIILATQRGVIQISATNLELGVKSWVSGKIIEEGSVCIPFQNFHKIITNSDSERINLSSENQNLIIETDNYKAVIQGVAPDEFPIIPTIKNQQQVINIKSATLKEALTFISPAIQVSEVRPEISGALFDYQITLIKLVATDTFRLAEKTISEKSFQGSFSQGFKIILPIKIIQEVLRIFPDNLEIQIFTDDNQVLFRSEAVEIISRLTDGNYPDYEAIIPKSAETELIIERTQFVNALKLVSSFSGKVNEIRIRLLGNKKTIEIYSASQDVGENQYLIPVKMSGQEFGDISFNWRYLLDGLKALTGESVYFGISGDAKPAILKTKESHNGFFIIMPIKA